jgi:hypothetical protein
VYRIPDEEQSQTAPGPSRVVGTYTTLLAQLSQHPSYVGRHPTRDLPTAAVLAKADELVELLPAEFGTPEFPSLPLDASYFEDPLARQEEQGRLPYEITRRYAGAGILQAVEQLSGCAATTRCRRWGASRTSRGSSPTTGRSTWPSRCSRCCTACG